MKDIKGLIKRGRYQDAISAFKDGIDTSGVKIRQVAQEEVKRHSDEITDLINNALYNGHAEPDAITESYVLAKNVENLIVESGDEIAGFYQTKSLHLSNSTYLSIGVTHPKYRNKGVYTACLCVRSLHALADGHEFEIGRTSNPKIVKILSDFGFEYTNLDLELQNAAIKAMEEVTGHLMAPSDTLIFPGKHVKTYPVESVREKSGNFKIDNFVEEKLKPKSCDRLVMIRMVDSNLSKLVYDLLSSLGF